MRILIAGSQVRVLPSAPFFASVTQRTRTYLRIRRVRDGAYLGAVLDGDRRRVLYVHKASAGDEMRPNGPVPSGRR